MKKLIKTIVIAGLIVGVPVVCYQQFRSFYCLSNDKCITVWKRIGGTCYIIPGKYYGIKKPSDNYIQTTNVSDIDFVWKKPNHILIAGKEVKIFNKNKDILIMTDYNQAKQHNDSLYLSFDGTYYRYKKDVNYISVNVKENYAKENNGKKL